VRVGELTSGLIGRSTAREQTSEPGALAECEPGLRDSMLPEFAEPPGYTQTPPSNGLHREPPGNTRCVSCRVCVCVLRVCVACRPPLCVDIWQAPGIRVTAYGCHSGQVCLSITNGAFAAPLPPPHRHAPLRCHIYILYFIYILYINEI
jgi:hypothetical protein